MRARQGIMLGWDHGESAPFGFGPHPTPAPYTTPILYDGDAPVTCIAPTGSGKGRGLIVPLLLTYPGPVIAIDIKGELSAVCRRARAAMGHRVAVIDPFRCTPHGDDRLNPFDLFQLPGAQLESDAEMMAALLGEGHSFKTDPFWTDTATALVSGLVAQVSADEDPAKRSMTQLRTMLYNEDVDYQLAVMLDKKEQRSQLVYDEVTAYLQICSDKTRPSVLSTARTFFRSLNSAQVARSLEDSTFGLADVVSGKPLDVFITVPPEKLKSHCGLLRLLIGTLMTAIMRRKSPPEQRTLFVLDEAASLGKEFEPLLTAATLLRGYGLSLVSVWQDTAQLKSRYPTDWQTILNNSGALLSFGFPHFGAAKEYAELFGLDPHQLMLLKSEEAVLSIRGQGARTVRRMDYLNDALFAGKFDSNPFYDKGSANAEGPG